ncbi:addiction module antidote protein [Vineibacter terrae]|uniref:addiction module antidote protein n=1 Tax=Vineibacter terrae TaxID=2586908 RepID=UPI002E33548E|nr:addiction module antidote protein [Vineibacter terrae]HEX2892123.1 addiction module antidote protein [Vineibacter terrae]
MAKRKTRSLDPAELLTSPEAIAVFLTDALETGDPAFVAAALGVVARAKGMTEMARETGVSRESLYRALSEGGNPEFATVLKVIKALGMQLQATPAS